MHAHIYMCVCVLKYKKVTRNHLKKLLVIYVIYFETQIYNHNFIRIKLNLLF